MYLARTLYFYPSSGKLLLFYQRSPRTVVCPRLALLEKTDSRVTNICLPIVGAVLKSLVKLSHGP